MAMGKRREERQAALFIATDGLAKSPGHPFYRKLNELLAEAEVDRWIERRCECSSERRSCTIGIPIRSISSGPAPGESASLVPRKWMAGLAVPDFSGGFITSRKMPLTLYALR